MEENWGTFYNKVLKFLSVLRFLHLGFCYSGTSEITCGLNPFASQRRRSRTSKSFQHSPRQTHITSQQKKRKTSYNLRGGKLMRYILDKIFQSSTQEKIQVHTIHYCGVSRAPEAGGRGEMPSVSSSELHISGRTCVNPGKYSVLKARV